MRIKSIFLTLLFVLGVSLNFHAGAAVSPSPAGKIADTLIDDASEGSIEISRFFIIPVEVNITPPSSSGRIVGRSHSGNSGNSHFQQTTVFLHSSAFGRETHCRPFCQKLPLPRRAIDYYLYFLYRLRL